MRSIQADAHSEHAQKLDPDASDTDGASNRDASEQNFDEHDEVLDGEREGLYTGEPPPVSDSEPARRPA